MISVVISVDMESLSVLCIYAQELTTMTHFRASHPTKISIIDKCFDHKRLEVQIQILFISHITIHSTTCSEMTVTTVANKKLT